MKTRFKLKKILPFALMAVGLIIGYLLFASRDEAPREEIRPGPVSVLVYEVERIPRRLEVEAQGTVIPSREVTLSPQVSGPVSYVNPRLTPGGIVAEGELLVAVDDREYRLGVAEARTALADAEARLEQEQGQQIIAQREWELFGDELDTLAGGSELALRDPQLKAAQAAVEAAETGLQRARLNLERTRIRAPFPALVRSAPVEVGQAISLQSQLATLTGIDEFWVQVSVPVDRLPFISIPGLNADTGSRAQVAQNVGAGEVLRSGRVLRLLGDLDPAGRMARLIVAIENPMETGSNPEVTHDGSREIPLLLDSYVDVTILSDTMPSLIGIPRAALHGGESIYVLGDDSTLVIREPEIFWRTRDSLLIGSGLDEGDKVIVSRIPEPVAGMPLRPEAASDLPSPGPS